MDESKDSENRFSKVTPQQDAEYIAAVEAGDMAKAGQMVRDAFKAAFPDMKVVDEKGEPLVVYHGDKAKGRYVFTPNTFFGETKEYAERYRRGEGEITSAFLNIRKPFDIRDKEARDIFIEYRGGHTPAQTESGAMDWAEYDYDDLQEYLEQKYSTKYDGFIMDEGADGGYGNDVKRRGLSYVPFYPNQIKSADPVTYDDKGNIIPLLQTGAMAFRQVLTVD